MRRSVIIIVGGAQTHAGSAPPSDLGRGLANSEQRKKWSQTVEFRKALLRRCSRKGRKTLIQQGSNGHGLTLLYKPRPPAVHYLLSMPQHHLLANHPPCRRATRPERAARLPYAALCAARTSTARSPFAAFQQCTIPNLASARAKQGQFLKCLSAHVVITQALQLTI